jgi:hypothetical protein
MRRDLLTMTGAFFSLALIVWVFWGNPERSSAHVQTVEWIKSDPELRLISQQSPYMRSER